MPKATAVFDAGDSRLSSALVRINGKILALQSRIAKFAGAFLDFLREHEIGTLHIVGDLIDIWQLRRGIYWPQEHNDVIQKILRAARKGTDVIYIPGNHDEFVEGFCGRDGNITIQKKARSCSRARRGRKATGLGLLPHGGRENATSSPA